MRVLIDIKAENKWRRFQVKDSFSCWTIICHGVLAWKVVQSSSPPVPPFCSPLISPRVACENCGGQPLAVNIPGSLEQTTKLPLSSFSTASFKFDARKVKSLCSRSPHLMSVAGKVFLPLSFLAVCASFFAPF